MNGSSNILKNYLLLIIAFVVLNLINWISWVEIRYGLPHIIKYLLIIFVLGTIILYRILKPASLKNKEAIYPVILWLVLWTGLILVNSIISHESRLFFQRAFADRFFFMPYLLPVILLYMSFDLDFFRDYFKYIYTFLILALIVEIYIVVIAISPDRWLEQMELINIFNIGSGFLLLTSQYSRKKSVQTVVILFYLFSIAFSLINGRRGLAIQNVLLLLFMVLLRLKSPTLTIRHRIKIYLIGIFIVAAFAAFGYLLASTYAFERGFGKDAFQESRGLVFEDFFEDFNTAGDWIFGRGIEGRVYRSIYMNGATLDIVEQGFLTIILRGGLLYLVPFTIIFLRAIYLGFFKSKNDMVKALAIIAFVHFFMMFSFNLPDFSVYYISVWISVVTCLTPKMRDYTDKDIYMAFNS